MVSHLVDKGFLHKSYFNDVIVGCLETEEFRGKRGKREKRGREGGGGGGGRGKRGKRGKPMFMNY